MNITDADREVVDQWAHAEDNREAMLIAFAHHRELGRRQMAEEAANMLEVWSQNGLSAETNSLLQAAAKDLRASAIRALGDSHDDG